MLRGVRVCVGRAVSIAARLCRASTNAWHKALKTTSLDASIEVTLTESSAMRTTLALDDDLLAKATALTGVTEKSALVREALRALIQRESAKRLAQLGGTMPDLQDVPRRQGTAR